MRAFAIMNGYRFEYHHTEFRNGLIEFVFVRPGPLPYIKAEPTVFGEDGIGIFQHATWAEVTETGPGGTVWLHLPILVTSLTPNARATQVY